MSRKNHKHHLDSHLSQRVINKFIPQEVTQEILISLVIPVYNCSEQIGMTLDSIKRQNYPHLEVIVVDASSTDRTVEIVNSYRPLITRVYTVTDYNLFDMINRGISLASGRYILFLTPGSLYISKEALHVIAHCAMENDYPELIYFGSIQREGWRVPRIIHLPLKIELLKRGVTPVTLPACCFRLDLFETMGKFHSGLTLRSGFDFLCRFILEKKCRAVLLDRVYIDFDYGHFSYAKLMKFATNTWRIISTHFGFWRAVAWFLGINHLNFVKWWARNLKQKAFKG